VGGADAARAKEATMNTENSTAILYAARPCGVATPNDPAYDDVFTAYLGRDAAIAHAARAAEDAALGRREADELLMFLTGDYSTAEGGPNEVIAKFGDIAMMAQQGHDGEADAKDPEVARAMRMFPKGSMRRFKYGPTIGRPSGFRNALLKVDR
jgi:hypothetical protein